MARGDHLIVYRNGIYHHDGVDVGGGLVIHVVKTKGATPGAAIRRVTIEEFRAGGIVQIQQYGTRLEPELAVRRAESKLGDVHYDLIFQNCEHFATWCITGKYASAQVEAVASGAGVIGASAVVPSLSVSLVSGAGEAAALSGPNLMSGLATIGCGSAMTGIAMVGGAAGVVGAGAMQLALRDKPTHTDEERQARRHGRHAAIGGAVLGVGAGLYAVNVMGTSGTSGVGLTTGLAALGGTIGGGMTRGIALVGLFPLLFAVLLGFIVYWANRPASSRALRPITA
jgi:hypothetical protein